VAKSKSTTANKKSSKPSSYSKAPAKKVVKKKQRGVALTIILALIFVHALAATVFAYNSLNATYKQTGWALSVLALVALADIVAAIAMWYWKRWGIYLYAIASVAAMAVHVMFTGSMMVAIGDLIPLGILGYVISLQSKQELFT
jgi:hypothetical protein